MSRESSFTHIDKNGNGRSAVVIGAGPGGIIAAKTLAEKGFIVTLFDKNNKIGGALLIGSNLTGKDKWVRLVNSWKIELKRLGVKIQLNTRVKDIKAIKALKLRCELSGGSAITPVIRKVFWLFPSSVLPVGSFSPKIRFAVDCVSTIE